MPPSLVGGREFTEQEETSTEAPHVAIVDTLLALKLFGDKDPLGHSIRIAPRSRIGAEPPGESYLIVGIAPPMREEVTDAGPVPHLYVASGPHRRTHMHLHVRGAHGGETALLAAIRRELRSVDPQLPILDLKTLRAFREESLGLWLLKACAMCARRISPRCSR